MGISRVYWPSWSGWVIIDSWLQEEINSLERDERLAPLVSDFYRVNFWDRTRGDVVAGISIPVACELFDTAVNMGVHKAVSFLQEALNMQNKYEGVYKDITVDGLLGVGTLNTLKRYFSTNTGTKEENEQILLACMNGEQYIAYKKNAQHERFRGWFKRV